MRPAEADEPLFAELLSRHPDVLSGEDAARGEVAGASDHEESSD